MRKKNYRCLLVQTPDNRKFFTHEENYKQIVEFANICSAHVALVNVQDAEVLDLGPLASAISDTSFNTPEPIQYELIENKINNIKKKTHRYTNDIRKFVSSKFDSGEVVSLKELMEAFKHTDISISCLCNHISQARKLLESNGRIIKKVGAGKYQMVA
jgi:hypothetical protein